MPRIGVALEVVTVVALCIAFNAVRYPAVGQMLKGESPAAEKAEPTAAPAAAAAAIIRSVPPAAKETAGAGVAATISPVPKPQPAVATEKYAHAAIEQPPQPQITPAPPPEIRRPLEPVVWPKASPSQPGRAETAPAMLVGMPSGTSSAAAEPSPSETTFCMLPPVEHTAPINPTTVCGPDGAIPFYPTTGL